jgi:hypothetical protein
MTGFRSTYIFFKTGYFNSRLGGQTLGKSHPKLSFDGMTIVKSLIKNIKIH